jgi:hypothetical protein
VEGLDAAQQVVPQHRQRRAQVGRLLRGEKRPDLLYLKAQAAQPADPDEGGQVGRPV